MTRAEPLVLGIETSCDETGVGIVRGRTLLTNTVATSMDEHVRFGGVVPEVASRAHVQSIGPMIEKALADAGVTLDDLDALAVTAGPGLSGALMVGAAAAKGLAASTGLPLYGINHLAAHVAVDLVAPDSPGLHTPTIALLVSGGHTEILRIGDIVDDIELLGATIDDAAGEAFDKTARLLGLDYPGGPSISRAAAGLLDGERRPRRPHCGALPPRALDEEGSPRSGASVLVLVLGPQDCRSAHRHRRRGGSVRPADRHLGSGRSFCLRHLGARSRPAPPAPRPQDRWGPCGSRTSPPRSRRPSSTCW